MYILIIKEPLFVGTFLEKSEILDKIKVARTTFNRNFKGGKWETDKFTVYQSNYVQKKSNKGDKRGKNLGKWLK